LDIDCREMQEILDDNDEKLKGLRNEYGEVERYLNKCITGIERVRTIQVGGMQSLKSGT